MSAFDPKRTFGNPNLPVLLVWAFMMPRLKPPGAALRRRDFIMFVGHAAAGRSPYACSKLTPVQLED